MYSKRVWRFVKVRGNRYLMIITWECHDDIFNLLCQVTIVWLMKGLMMKLATSQKCKIQMEAFLSDETFLQRAPKVRVVIVNLNCFCEVGKCLNIVYD